MFPVKHVAHVNTMTEPERPINTFYAFCSLLLPGLGQLLQKRAGAAIGFFALFLLTGFLPVLIVSLLFMDRFSQETMGIHIIHVLIFLGICFPLMFAFFCAVIDAAAWKPGDRTRFKPYTIVGGILFFGVLVFLLLPFVPSAREAAKRAQCLSNMKHIAFAFHLYHDVHGYFPPAYTVDEDGKPLHSWRVLILPYMEQTILYEQIRLGEPWDSEHNRQFHEQVPNMFRCPSSPREASQCSTCLHIPVRVVGGTTYSIVYGAETPFTGSQPTKKEGIAGGLSDTIFLVERRTPVNWMNPSQEITFETAVRGINVDAMGISSYHAGGVNVALGDGSVRFISDNIDLETLRALLMRDGATGQFY